MLLVLFHTVAQLLIEWVLIGVLLLGTVVALLIEPVHAVLRRWAARRPTPERPIRRRRAAHRRGIARQRLRQLGTWVLLGGVLIPLGLYGLNPTIALLGRLFDRLGAPDRLVALYALHQFSRLRLPGLRRSQRVWAQHTPLHQATARHL